MTRDAATRFTGRVESYARYRPGYPDGVLPLLRLAPGSVVADVGSGTGISAELFLRAGHVVYGVEPNAGMRTAAETLLAGYPGFHSVAGSAEDTTLGDASVDVVVAGQAFHWFDADRARAEFARILRPGGRVALLWNTRLDTTPFLRAFEALLQEFGTDYGEVRHDAIGAEVLAGFYAGEYERHTLPNEQRFGFEGLRGRLLSMSYVPAEGDPRHLPTLRELERIFKAHARDGEVRMEYDTEIYIGRVG